MERKKSVLSAILFFIIAILTGTGKITFCIHDFAPMSDHLPGKPEEAVYPSCGSNIQGISVGWEDTYRAGVPGQEIEITNLLDETYAFQAIVDPENRIIEKDENNNVTTSYIKITGSSVEIIE